MTEQTSMKDWVDVVGFEGFYQVSPDGRVRSLDRDGTQVNRHGSLTTRIYRGRELKPWSCKKGYLYVTFSVGGKREQRSVHSLVAQHFLDGTGEVNHKDMDKTNNRASNLEWVTHYENVRHFVDSGQHHAANNPNMARKLTREKVIAIRVGRAAGRFLKDLANEHGVSEASISNICSGKTWEGAQ